MRPFTVPWRVVAALLLAGLFAAAMAGGAEEAGAAPAPLRLRSGYSALSGPHAALWVTKEEGLFEKYGLRVDAIYIRSGSAMAQTLVAGDLQIAQTGGPAVLAAAVAGADLAIIAVAFNTTPIVLMSVPSVQKIQDLAGKAIGVTRYGSNTDISARFALRKAGLEPEKQVAVLQLDEYPSILAAMRSGRIAAGALADPFTIEAKKMGFRDLVDVAALGLEFPFITLTARKSYLRTHEAVALNFVRAYSEGIKLYTTSRETAIRVTAKYTRLPDVGILAGTVEYYAPRMSKVPYPTINGVKFLLEQIAVRNPKARELTPEAFVDLHFVKALEQEGFYRKLYGR